MKNNLCNNNELHLSLKISDIYYLLYTAIVVKSKWHKGLIHWLDTLIEMILWKYVFFFAKYVPNWHLNKLHGGRHKKKEKKKIHGVINTFIITKLYS